jgi:gas vesicle protein
MELTVGELSAIMGGAFALTTTIIGILVKTLFGTYKEKSTKEIESLQRSVELELKAIKEARETCFNNHEKQQNKLSDSIEKLNDSWLTFVREDAAMEATRGRKVDALFNVVDHMKEKLNQIPDLINKKFEDVCRDIKRELMIDLSDYVKTTIKNTNKSKEV